MGKGDRRVQPSDQLPVVVVSECAGVAESAKAAGKGSLVAFKQCVDQAERDGLPAPRIRVELRDPREHSAFPGVV